MGTYARLPHDRIIWLYEGGGVTYAQLAAEYDCTPVAIHQIIKKKAPWLLKGSNWRHPYGAHYRKNRAQQ